MSQPRVSVIVPAYNALPELTECITSVMEQTIGLDRLEIIAVDDGSTDGTGKELDRLAALCPALHVIHQENSGTAAVPRNVALDIARGDYVFFLDSDDYLGPDALRRMVAMADENRTDIVLGKMVSVGGRPVPTAVFRSTQPRTDIFSSAAYRTLGCWKLFRRSLLDRLELRFPPLRNTEDKPFTATAYLNADGVSVVADYDCYYHRDRENGNNLTLTAQSLGDRMQGTRMCFETVARHLKPGPRRDQIMRRHVEWELCGPVWWLLLRESEEDIRERIYPELRDWVANWVTDAIIERLEPRDRLLLHLLRADRFAQVLTVVRDAKKDAGRGHVIDAGRAYWNHPLFRDRAVGVPDSAFDVTDRLPVHQRTDSARWHEDGVLRLTGHAYLEDIAPEDATTDLLLRCYDAEQPEIRVPTRAHPAAGAGYTAELDLRTAAAGAPLGRGRWNIFLDVRARGVRRTVRLKAPAGQQLPYERPPYEGITVTDRGGRPLTLTPYVTPWGNLSLNAGQEIPRDDPRYRVTGMSWHRTRTGTLTVTGTAADGNAQDTPDPGALRLRVENSAGDRRELPVTPGRNGDGFTAELAVRGLRPGRWTVTLAPPGAPSVAVPCPAGLGAAHWFRFARPYAARPVAAASETTLVVEVRPVAVTGVARRKLGEAVRRMRK